MRGSGYAWIGSALEQLAQARLPAVGLPKNGGGRTDGRAATIGKLMAGFVTGAIIAVLAAFLFAVVAGAVSSSVHQGVPWIVFGSVLGNVTLAMAAERYRVAWGRGFLLCGLLCLALSIAPLALTVAAGGRSIAAITAAESDVLVGGADLEAVIVIVFGMVGLCFGAIFLAGAFFALRQPRVEPRRAECRRAGPTKLGTKLSQGAET